MSLATAQRDILYMPPLYVLQINKLAHSGPLLVVFVSLFFLCVLRRIKFFVCGSVALMCEPL